MLSLLILLLMVQMLQHTLMLVLLQILSVLLRRDAEDWGGIAMHWLVALPAGSRLLIDALLPLLHCQGPLRIPGVFEEVVDSRHSFCFVLHIQKQMSQST